MEKNHYFVVYVEHLDRGTNTVEDLDGILETEDYDEALRTAEGHELTSSRDMVSIWEYDGDDNLVDSWIIKSYVPELNEGAFRRLKAEFEQGFRDAGEYLAATKVPQGMSYEDAMRTCLALLLTAEGGSISHVRADGSRTDYVLDEDYVLVDRTSE